MENLVNRVANSGLVTIKVETLAPERTRTSFDLAEYLWQGLALREKEFRQALRAIDWETYAADQLCVFCSTDAIIPQWTYMLVTSYAAAYVEDVFIGTPEEAESVDFAQAVATLDVQAYQDQRVILKGCTNGRSVGAQAYATLSKRLLPHVKSLMYGEPCSTVPIYKKKR